MGEKCAFSGVDRGILPSLPVLLLWRCAQELPRSSGVYCRPYPRNILSCCRIRLRPATMSQNNRRLSLAQTLARAAADYQTAEVIPHCARCARPCCKLDALVLELDWKQVRTLWRIEEARPAFDRRLAAGKGPVEIRESGGLYYIHSKPCPAFDPVQGGCRIYDQPLKPVGCSDFPVYEDGGDIIADLRCEAVDADALARRLADAVGPDCRIVRRADEEFPFLLTLSPRKTAGRNRR